jgi:hypothetical protein
MKSLATAVLVAAGALGLAATGASATVVCNDDGDCWHVKGKIHYKPEFHLHTHPDNWKWARNDHYKWREHGGHGYWKGGVWIDL